MNFKQIKRAVIAKTKDKSNMPDWYYKRLEKCFGCEFNSGNQEKLSFKDRIRISHNFGKDACLKCTCGVEDLSSDPLSECEAGFWQKESVAIDNKIGVEIAEEEIVELSYEEKVVVLDYGVIEYNSNSTINLQLITNKYETYTIAKHCGCTVPKLKENEKGYILNISYDTKRLGNFNKTVNITFINTKPKLSRENFAIKIKGTVTNKL